MIETGIDIIEISRFEKILSDNVFIEKYFTQSEIVYSQNSSNSAQHFAVRFAAKEAVRKILLNYIKPLSWKGSWIENRKNGSPILCLSQKVLSICEIKSYSISLTHTNDIAAAVVIMEME